MLNALTAHWRLFFLRGVCALIFGVVTLVWPGRTLLTLVLIYGTYVLVDGFLSFATAVRGGAPTSRWWLAIVGVLGIAAGVLTFLWPGVTSFVLLVLIATWAIATGVVEIAGALQLRREIRHEWMLIAGGIVSVFFGIMALRRPAAGALAVVVVIGAYAITHGVLLLSFAFRLRRWHVTTRDERPLPALRKASV